MANDDFAPQRMTLGRRRPPWRRHDRARIASADTLDDIRRRACITVGVGVMGAKPWVWQNEDGTYGGMEYEMLEYITAKLGVSQVRVRRRMEDASSPASRPSAGTSSSPA